MHFRFYSNMKHDQNSPVSQLPDGYYLRVLKTLGTELPLVVATFGKKLFSDFLARHQIVRDVLLQDSLFDFYMLSRAERLAISNSSFSWWAAYLSCKKQILAPHRHFWFGAHERANSFWDPPRPVS